MRLGVQAHERDSTMAVMRLSILAGVLIGIAFLHAWLWFLVLIGLALFAHNLTTSKTYHEAVQKSAVTGIVKGLIVTV